MNDVNDHTDSLKFVSEFAKSLEKQDREECSRLYAEFEEKVKPLLIQFRSFSEKCSPNSEICRYWDGVIEITSKLHNLIAADREGDWEGHLQAVQDLFPVRLIASITYATLLGTWKR